MSARQAGSPLTIAWTGHRPIYFADPAAAERAVHEVTRRLRCRRGQSVRFVTGGQNGVDLWAAEAALDAGIPFDVCLPLPLDAFTADWDATARERLRRVCERAAACWVVPPSENPYFARDQALVDCADRLEVCWTGLRSGGTWDTIQRAQRAGLSIRFHHFAWSGRTPDGAAPGV